jgi:hypothetical protein
MELLDSEMCSAMARRNAGCVMPTLSRESKQGYSTVLHTAGTFEPVPAVHLDMSARMCWRYPKEGQAARKTGMRIKGSGRSRENIWRLRDIRFRLRISLLQTRGIRAIQTLLAQKPHDGILVCVLLLVLAGSVMGLLNRFVVLCLQWAS